VSLTTTGTGAATFNQSTGALNIPIPSSLSLSAIGSTPNANGATITGSVLNLQPASISFGGVISLGAQVLGSGNKTIYNGDLILDKGTGVGGANGNIIMPDDRSIYFTDSTGPYIAGSKTSSSFTIFTPTSGTINLYGNIKLNNYGAGLKTGTSAYNLSITSTGQIIETALTAAIIPSSVTSTGAITSSGTAGIGYATGAGGTVTQLLSKGNSVDCQKITGKVTTFASALAAGAIVTFPIQTNFCKLNDLVILNHASGGTAGPYLLTAQAMANGINVYIRNTGSTSLSEAIVISFAIIKSVIA
ncbi:MAG: hypothetical protein H7321_00450, partial [Bacteroidia bacterium]|nr:hypothetical protein [Bacteroidia bacterium]